MSELSPKAREILEAARRESAPHDADRRRIQASLSALLGPLPLPEAQPLRPSSQSVTSGSLAVKVGVGALVVLAGVGAVALWHPARTEPPIAPATPVASALVAAHAPPPPVAVPVVPEAPVVREAPRSRPAAPAPVPAPAPKFAPMDLRGSDSPPPAAPSAPVPATPAPQAGSLADELALLREAQLASGRGEPARAIALLDEHARRYPKGALREERAAARITALCALGRKADARDEADRFLAESPQSPYAGRVRDSCAGQR